MLTSFKQLALNCQRFLLAALLGSLAIANGPNSEASNETEILSFEQRVFFQRAVEEVYWKHRIWPKENKLPKPPLSHLILDSVIRAKVSDYLRESDALEKYWHRPITATQLQTEIDRVVKQTKNIEMLRELFAALRNDPYVIAECLARPALAARLTRNIYIFDRNIHGEVFKQAQNDIKLFDLHTMNRMRGYREQLFVRKISNESGFLHESSGEVELSQGQWNQFVEQLETIFGRQRLNRDNIDPVGARAYTSVKRLSNLHEDQNRFYVIAVLEKKEERMRIATVEWRKQPFSVWWAQIRNSLSTNIATPVTNYSLPSFSSRYCEENKWVPTFSGVPGGRDYQTAVWTGAEMIVWGGNGNGGITNTGGRYDPASDSWTATDVVAAPDARVYHTAIWTGTQMIVWGGVGDAGVLNSGGRYDPVTDSWSPTSMLDAPIERYIHSAVWSGSEMIVWGGYHANYTPINDGGRYNPITNTWTPVNVTNAPTPRGLHTVVWTGTEMIIWGGYDNNTAFNSGGRYNPTSDNWASTDTTTAPAGRGYHTAIWTGSEMIIWGGANGINLKTGGRYNPTNDSWVPTDSASAPEERREHTAVWSGTEMIIWGGNGNSGFINTGGRYDVLTDTWIPTDLNSAPIPRTLHNAVWTDSEMIIWGGIGSGDLLSTGGRYDPASDAWTPTDTTTPPIGRIGYTSVWTGTEMIIFGGDANGNLLASGSRYDPVLDIWIDTADAFDARWLHTAVWTGSEMIVWGGFTFHDGLNNTGNRYDPVSDSWIETNAPTAPEPRYWHTAVWTGNEMIVWGGFNDSAYLNSGGRYDPTTDTWLMTDTLTAPEARYYHTAVWTGSEMIIWGGTNASGDLNTGGRYNPSADSWMPTDIATAPDVRNYHTATWSGTHMIIWGGFHNSGYYNSGGRYDLVTNTWLPTTAINAPSARAAHTAVWTGKEMIIWGGNNPAILNTGGRYNPTDDSWNTTDVLTAPEARTAHTAVWTGSHMIIWGGDGNLFSLNSGGQYHPGIFIDPEVLPSGTSGIFYDITLEVTGASSPYTFAVTAGTLPDGLVLDPLTGQISGTPGNGGSFSFSITVTDSVGCIGNRNYTIVIGCLYCEEFDTVPDWNISGNWSISNSRLYLTSDRKKATAIATPAFSGCQICYEEASIATTGGYLSSVSMLGWFVDSRNKIELVLKPNRNKIILRQRVNGMVVAKAKGSILIVPDTPSVYRINFNGSLLSVFVDGNELFTMMPLGEVPSGTVGFLVKKTTGTFDYIRVNP